MTSDTLSKLRITYNGDYTPINEILVGEVVTAMSRRFFKVLKIHKKERYHTLENLITKRIVKVGWGTSEFIVLSKLSEEKRDKYRQIYKQELKLK